jgi:hypothetical protein
MRVHRILVGAALAIAAAALVPTVAQASSYTISQRAAQLSARDAAEFRYAAWGVTADAAACRPQGYTLGQRRYWSRYTWHRWVCAWVGTDADGADVQGFLRITGHSDGSYGHMPLYGGLRWS